jgi:hypothetical protein
MTFTDGVAEFTLKDGESKIATGLPSKISYSVTEEEAEGYQQQGEGTTGIIEKETKKTVTFTNTYSANGKVRLIALKVLEGRDLKGGEFTFELKDAEQNVLQTVTNAADGTVIFEPIEYTLDDVKNSPIVYTISEVLNEEDVDTIYDTHVETITVTLTDLGDGTIQAVPDKKGAAVTFRNRVPEVEVRKVDVLDGKEVPGATMRVYDKDKNLIDEWVSTTEAHVVTGLKVGMVYTLHEEVAPTGYRIALDATFIIAKDGTVTYTGKTGTDGALLVEDERQEGTVRIRKEFLFEQPEPTETPTPTPTETPTPTPTVTPTPTPKPEPKLTEIPVTKTWVDNDNRDGNRPKSIKVHLLADGVEIDSATLDAGNAWKHVFTGLKKTDAAGNEILYTITEDPVPWYETKISGYNITNTYKAPTTEVEVRKVWNDDDNRAGMRPLSIHMKLSNGMSVTLNESNGWYAKITGLPLIVKGKPVTYTWTEQEVLGYELESVKTKGTLTTFTNKILGRPKPPEGKKLPPTRGTPYVTFEEYGTPLGLEVLINHVGDCFD